MRNLTAYLGPFLPVVGWFSAAGANLNQINMKSFSNVAGFSALVLLGSAVAVPGMSVLFALCGVVAGAVWVLDQCSPSTPQE